MTNPQSAPRLGYTRAHLDRATLTEAGPLRFTASSEGVNCYGFSLRNEGWRLENYAANPVFMWMHETWTLPIGRALAASKDRQILADVDFDQDDPFARAVESKYRRGFLNAVSVGWDFVEDDGSRVLDWWRLEQKRIDELFFELHEISAVPVPGDPRAVIQQSRLALRRLGRELVDLYDEQENPASPFTAEQINAAVHAELTRLGIDLGACTTRVDAHTTPGRTESGIDRAAADAVLAAFTLEGTPS